MNFIDIEREADSIAQAVISEIDSFGGDFEQLLHEAVDGHELVIYNSSSWDMVGATRMSDYNRFYHCSEMSREWADSSTLLDQMVTYTAYEILHSLALEAYEKFRLNTAA